MDSPNSRPDKNERDTSLRFASSPLQALVRRFRVTPDRFKLIYDDIFQGSTPELGYYALISAAALIASLGLVANSVAVVIGAMLVSPLMTPIFGMAMGMIRGNPQLLGRAVRAEVGGVFLAVAFGYLFGVLPIMTGITPEMLSRTEPTLLDLLVAVFAGLAGTLAVVDARISPALPGVAISTAIVPPLATSGLCLAYGSYEGALGAFLLFFANFLAILLVSSITFLMCGMGQFEQEHHKKLLMQRLLIAGGCFLIVSFFLTNTLIQVVESRTKELVIDDVLENAMKPNPNASFTSMRFKEVDGGIHVLATFRTSHTFTPREVRILENKLQDRLKLPVLLVARCSIAKDVAPTGAFVTNLDPSLDGKFKAEEQSWQARHISVAEQALREFFDGKPQYLLVDVDMTKLSGEQVLIATVQTPRALVSVEIEELEKILNHALGDTQIRLLVRDIVTNSVTSRGRILFGRAHFGSQPEGVERIKNEVIQQVKALKGFVADNVDVIQEGDGYIARAEIVGPRGINSQEIAAIEANVKSVIGLPVELHAWSRVELMVDDSASMSVDAFAVQRFEQQMKEKNMKETQKTDVEKEDQDVPAAVSPQDSIEFQNEKKEPGSNS